MCIQVLNIYFFYMLLYKNNVIIKKKHHSFKFEAAIFTTKPEGVDYTEVK